MHITEQHLSEAGGWQAMKAAREFVKLSQVFDAQRDAVGYHGFVGLGKGRYRASLLVDERGRVVEGKCACGDGRRGVICPHVLAVALQVIKGQSTTIKVSHSMSGGLRKGNEPANDLSQKIRQLPPKPKQDLQISVLLEQLIRLDQNNGSVPVFLRWESGNGQLSDELWSWLVARGWHQVPATRMSAEEFKELLNLGYRQVSWWTADKTVKFKNKLLVKNDISGFFTIQTKENTKSVHVQLFEGIIYRNAQKGLVLLEGGENQAILIFIQDGIKNQFKDLIAKGNQEFFIRDIVKNPDPYQQLTSGIETWLNPLKISHLDLNIILKIEGNLKKLLCQVLVEVGEGVTHLLLSQDDNNIYPIQDELDKNRYYVRNIESEKKASHVLQQVGLSELQAGLWSLQGETKILEFLAHGLPKLRKFYQVLESESFRQISSQLVVIRPRLKAPEDRHAEGHERDERGGAMDWLNLEVAYEAENGLRISRNEVLRLLRSGQRQGKTAQGKRFVLDVEGCEELEETLQDVTTRLEGGGQRVMVKRWQAGVLTEFADKNETWDPIASPLDLSVMEEKLADLAGTLRLYQKEGVHWMERLGRSHLGGLLADEMGLGKTVQTLGMTRILLQQRENKKEPALVICPTSLLGNWKEEAAKFVPELRVHVSHDVRRHEHWEGLHEYDLILTSYQLVVRDLEHLSKMIFSVVVMDEASYVRNSATATSQAVSQLKKRSCFALTGTPVENSVKDLWSIFEVVLPGYLPRKEVFHDKYVKKLNQPDEKLARVAMERLRRLIRPYLLRRTKIEVAKDLPQKMEQVIWCDLSPMQKEVYTRILEEGREEIRSARRRSGQGAARMTMFTVLLRLRQVCNDLRLLGMKEESVSDDGKWPRFDEMVQELIEGDHRALVFSQFVGMLKLVRQRLDAEGIEYCYLDGATQNRSEQVSEFQKEGSSKRFFLISLKAGGYGLNLTAADHVMLLDPWWNPAVEAQAIDRAHRIGQLRPVTAARFIMRGTVEEKILQLQQKKRAVMDMAMDEEVTVMTGVTDEELEAMLEG